MRPKNAGRSPRSAIAIVSRGTFSMLLASQPYTEINAAIVITDRAAAAEHHARGSRERAVRRRRLGECREHGELRGQVDDGHEHQSP